MECLTVPSQGTFGNVLRHFFVVTNGGGECIIGNLSADDKDVVKYSTMHVTAPTAKNYSAQVSIVQRLRNFYLNHKPFFSH